MSGVTAFMARAPGPSPRSSPISSTACFSFTDLPVRLLTLIGILGMGIAVIIGLLHDRHALGGPSEVTGYAATIVTIMFFGALNTLGLGLVGVYAWRAYENTKRRPMPRSVQPRASGRRGRIRPPRLPGRDAGLAMTGALHSSPGALRKHRDRRRHQGLGIRPCSAGGRNRCRLQYLRRRFHRERCGCRRSGDRQMRRPALGRHRGRGRRLHRTQRHLHQRPVPAQPPARRAASADARPPRRLHRRQCHDPARARRSAPAPWSAPARSSPAPCLPMPSWSATRRGSSGMSMPTGSWSRRGRRSVGARRRGGTARPGARRADGSIGCGSSAICAAA